MPEYFVVLASCAYPSDIETSFVEGFTVDEAAETVRREYSNLAGIYSIRVYSEMTDYCEHRTPKLTWLFACPV